MSKSPKTWECFGFVWDAEFSILDVHFYCIQQGDQWCKEQGRSLFYHQLEVQKLLWPEDDVHRWLELGLKSICENEITIFLGSSDSGKTYGISRFVLVDWWSNPNKTLWLVSSTELRGAELRIWGVLKQLFNRARERFPDLPGQVIESLHCITTEKISEDQSEGRLLTKGIIFVPCFPSGTLVDTPTGPRPIEELKIGDQVLNAQGIGIIKEVHNRIADQLVRVFLSDGRTIDCTEEHPFFTQDGWKNARDLKYGHRVFSAYETMRIMQGTSKGSKSSESEILFDMVSAARRPNKMRNVREKISALENSISRTCWAFLQSCLRRTMGVSTSRASSANNEEMQPLRKTDEVCSSQQRFLLEKMPAEMGDTSLRAMRKIFRFDSGFNSASEDSFLQSILQEESDWTDMCEKARFADARRTISVEAVPKIHSSLSYSDRTSAVGRSQTLVSDRYCVSESETGYRNRRRCSSDTIKGEKGFQKNQNFEIAWVDRVEILEQGSDPRFDKSKGGYSVHNIEVEGHPSYSVNGVVVHNCKKGNTYIGMGSLQGIKPQPGGRLGHVGDECQAMPRVFLDSYSNWYGKEGFKGLLSGNPFDLDDSLCVAAEPVEGWTAWKDTGKTQTWRSKFYNAFVVALDGRDTPNNDFPADKKTKYPYLIGRKKMDAVAKTHGLESWQFANQCIGKPRPGVAARRVVTRAMCEQYHAFDDVIWLGNPTVKIGACDAAYGGVGGDRCVAGYIEFGKDISGHEVIACHPPVIVPVSINKVGLPENQIAEFLKQYMDSVGVLPNNFFFDGRGSLAVAIARTWSPQVEAVEFGGVSTERPVSNDTYIWVGDERQRRLQKCNELYSKFVTELWFTVHYTIISDQVRQLPREVCDELCRREWNYTKGNRIEVETKADMKLRTGESPDLADWLVTAFEGARRRGFAIQRLPGESEVEQDNTWKHDLRLRAKRLRESYQLVH